MTSIRTGVEHHQAGRLLAAESVYRQILTENPQDFDALHLLGVIMQETGQPESAVELIKQAIQIKPEFAPAHSNLGNALKSAGRLDDAIAAYRKAVELDPKLARGHFNLGKALADKREFASAAASYRKAVEIRPDFAEAYGNLGAALAGMNDLAGAIAAYRRPIEMNPNSVQAWAGLGFALLCVGELEQAEEACRKAIKLDPNYPDGHWNLAQVLLTRGDYENGLPEYEWRVRLKGAPQRPELKAPKWAGQELQGKTIFLYAEEGFGDTIWFARYLPLLAQRGANLILACPVVLHRLLRSLPCPIRLLRPEEDIPEYDYQSSLFSLPFAFATRLDSIPADVPYLKADPEIVEKWKPAMAGAGKRLKVGLAWSGRPLPYGRSIPPESLKPLSNPNVQFFGLQDGLADPNVINLKSQISDFADTAAVIHHLDLLITIDTAAAQLAGAMGKPAWVLLKRIPDWRWLLDRESSPWYPTLKLYRQTAWDDWTSPIERAAADLRSLTEARCK